MNFIGKYKNGHFEPLSEYKDRYQLFINKAEKLNTNINLSINPVSRQSEAQLGFFNHLLYLAKDHSGSDYNELLKLLEGVRPKKYKKDKLVFISLSDLNTKELSELIELTIIIFNDKLNMNLTYE